MNRYVMFGRDICFKKKYPSRENNIFRAYRIGKFNLKTGCFSQISQNDICV